MNVYDWVIVAVLVVTALIGLSKGAVTMALTVAGLFVAMLISGQFAAPVVRTFTDSVDNEALATAIGYIVIFVLIFIAIGIASRFIRIALTITMLGWTDKLGGAALGIIVGFMLSIGLTMVGARYAYVFEKSEDGSIINRVEEFVQDRGRGRVDEYLTESELVPTLINIRNAIPGRVIGLVPGDFNTAMDTLEERRS